MARTKQMGLRLPEELVVRLDRYLDKLREDLPGVELTRTDAIRTLLEKGLQQAGIPSKAERKRKR